METSTTEMEPSFQSPDSHPISPPQPIDQEKSFTFKAVAGALLVLIPIVGLGGYFYGKQSAPPQAIVIASPTPESPTPSSPADSIEVIEEGVMCTMEAKQCPDGSYVGRSGPNCEFAACPVASSSAKTSKTKTPRIIAYKKLPNTKTFTSATGYTYNYPENQETSGESVVGAQHGYDEDWCRTYFGSGMIIEVSPYSTENLKDTFFSRYRNLQQGYTHSFEDVTILGKKSLLIEVGPFNESGGGTGVVIPFKGAALVMLKPYVGKDSQEVIEMLQSVNAQTLDISKCGK